MQRVLSPTLMPTKRVLVFLGWFLGLVVGGIGLAFLGAYLLVRFLFYIFLGRF